MPQITPHGYYLPDDGERGTWWGNLKSNWSRMDQHKHDGIDSAPINVIGIAKVVQTLLAANWVATANGLYSQTVTVPLGLTFPEISMEFYLNTAPYTGHLFFPSIETLSTTTFKIFVNDPLMEVKAVYA